MHNIPFNNQPIDVVTADMDEEGAKAVLKCPIPIQKETPTGLVDSVCKNDVPNHHAGLCRLVNIYPNKFGDVGGKRIVSRTERLMIRNTRWINFLIKKECLVGAPFRILYII